MERNGTVRINAIGASKKDHMHVQFTGGSGG